MIGAVVAFLLTLLIVIGFHEAGHAAAARLFGIKIEKISIGFGRTLYSYQSASGIKWIYKIWPLGGSVQLLNSRIHPILKTQSSQSFDGQSISKRFFVLVAGSLVNLIMAFCFFTTVNLIGYQRTIPIIQTILPLSAAEKAHLKPADRLLEVDKTRVHSWQEVATELIIQMGRINVEIKVQSPNENPRTVLLNLSELHFSRQLNLFKAIGIDLQSQRQTYETVQSDSLQASLKCALFKILHYFYFFIMLLVKMITGIIPFSVLLGPLGFFSLSIQSFWQGVSVYLNFIGLASLAVGFVNLFPVPGLDGGSMLYLLIEKLRKEPISVATEILMYQLAKIWMFFLLVQLLINDLKFFTHL